MLAFFVLLIGLTFACLNAEKVTINYYIGVKQLPLSLLLIFAFVFGAFFGLFFSVYIYIRHKREQSRLKQHISIIEKESFKLTCGAIGGC